VPGQFVIQREKIQASEDPPKLTLRGFFYLERDPYGLKVTGLQYCGNRDILELGAQVIR
jgi:hypothetical protein